MIKRLMIGTAIGALIATGAIAQSTSPTSPSPGGSPPAATAPSSSSGKADFVTSQKPDQFLASKFKGTDVIGNDNKKIGDVSDILFDKEGKIEAYVVSVGGFLGVGSKEVALPPKSFEVTPGENGAAPKLKVSATLDELKNAQNFARYESPRPTATTGSSGGGLGGTRPSGGGMAPSGK
jgi:sporulation protein YlmC with PRC-barrel domain